VAFLAGLLHDIGKCHPAWQEYVRGARDKGPPHAPLGAALFAWVAEQLTAAWSLPPEESKRVQDLCLDWARIVYNHHDELDDLDLAPPWEKSWSPAELAQLLRACDWQGIVDLVRSFFPEFSASVQSFARWLEEFSERWERRVRFGRPELWRKAVSAASPARPTEAPALRLAQLAGLLVSADRYHAGGFQVHELAAPEAERALQTLAASCRARADQALAEGAHPQLVTARGLLQQQAAELYLSSRDALFFSLTLPTGYGKTLTALRVALEAVRTGRCRRIIYVAPYLSILSQAASEIANATGLHVVEHHHLSILEQCDDEDVEALDTWQVPVQDVIRDGAIVVLGKPIHQNKD
jgi:CRISPR-associated endonuclease Cas3-HD